MEVGRIFQVRQIFLDTSFTAGKVTAVICGGLALFPHIKQGWVCLYRVSGNTVWSHTAGEASAAHCWLGALEMEMSTARIGHRAVRGPVHYQQRLTFNLILPPEWKTAMKPWTAVKLSINSCKAADWQPEHEHWESTVRLWYNILVGTLLAPTLWTFRSSDH